MFRKELEGYLRSDELPSDALIDRTWEIQGFLMDIYKMVYNTLLSKEFNYLMGQRKPKEPGMPILTTHGIEISK